MPTNKIVAFFDANLPMKITLEVGVSKTIFQVWLQLKQELM